MALGLKDILYLFMGILAVGMIVFFSLYELSTYGSVRDVVGNIALQPSEVVNLHSQYNEMTDQFNNGKADTYTYHWGSQAISVAKSQAGNEQQTLGLVLDQYSSNLYNGRVTGDLATANNVAGSGANGFYFLMVILLFAASVTIVALSYIQQWYETPTDLLKSAGGIILAMSALAFIVFLIGPPVIESAMWNSLNSSDWVREVNTIVEPRITSTLLVNTLILVLLGALLYGAGFLLHINMGEGEPDAMRYVREAPRMREQNDTLKVRSAPGKTQAQNKPGRRQL